MRKAAPLRERPEEFFSPAEDQCHAEKKRCRQEPGVRATKRRREKCQLGETVPLIRPTDGNGFTHRLWR